MRVLFIGGPADGKRLESNDLIAPSRHTEGGEPYQFVELADLSSWRGANALGERLYFYVWERMIDRGWIETLWAGYRDSGRHAERRDANAARAEGCQSGPRSGHRPTPSGEP